MKIGIDIRSLAESQYSGISEYTHNLLTHLFAIDRNNEYILFSNAAKRQSIPIFDFPNVSQRISHYPNKLFNISAGVFKLFAIDKFIGGVDLFLMPNFIFTNISPGTKTVIIVHDLSFELYPEFFTFKKRLWHKLIGPKALCQKADRIIAISKHTKHDLVNCYDIAEDKISLVHPGTNDIFFDESFQAMASAVKEKYQLPDRFLFYLGNLEPRKNVMALIKAFELIKDPSLHLVIAGGKAWKYQSIYQHYEQSPKKDRIHFLGYVENNEKPALYHLAAVFIYPSVYEGFGLPPIESMAAGTPVITSYSSSLPEAVGDAAILVDPYNYHEIAIAVHQVLSDDVLYENLRQKGLERAQQFRWTHSAQKILDIINSLNS